MRKVWLVVLLAVVIAFGSVQASTAQEKNEIVVGMTLCLTGRFAVDVGPFDKKVKAWEKKVKTVGYVGEDTPHTREVYEGAIPNAEQRGFKTVFKEIAPAGTTDFTSIMLKLKAADPDVIYVSSFTPFAVTFKKQTKEFGLKPREWHFTHFDKSFSGALGNNANYVTGTHHWLPGMPYGNLNKFHEILKQAKIDPEEYLDVSLHYGALEVAEVGIEKAESLKPDDLMKSLKAVKFDSVMGPMYFDQEKGHSFFQNLTAQYIDGKYYILAPTKFATHQHIYPNPQP